jgi:hypothetical protein
MQLPRVTLSFGASDTSKQAVIPVSGESTIFDVTIGIPDWTNAITTTFSILNANGKTIYSIAALVDPQLDPPCYLQVARKITGGSQVKVVLSGVSGNTGDVTIDIGCE